MAERGSPAHTSRAGRGICKCADSEAISLLYHSAWQYGAGAQDSDGGDWCQMSAISSFSLSLLSLHAQIHTHALQHWLPLFPLASPSCLLLWPDEPSLFICYYIGIVRSKNQEGACGVCQHCWLKVRVYCRSSPLRPLLSFTFTPPINFYLTQGNHTTCLCVCVRVYALQIPAPFALAANWLFASHHPAWLHAPHLSTTASEGFSAVLMRINMFVLFICVSP